jgi:hypothetical protein
LAARLSVSSSRCVNPIVRTARSTQSNASLFTIGAPDGCPHCLCGSLFGAKDVSPPVRRPFHRAPFGKTVLEESVPYRGDACAMDALRGISNSGRDAVCTREGTAVRSLPKLTPPRPNGLIPRAGDEAGTRFRWVQTGRMVQGGRLHHHRRGCIIL